MCKKLLILINLIVLSIFFYACGSEKQQTPGKTTPAKVANKKQPVKSADKRKVFISGKTVMAEKGADVCVDIVVRGFKDVLSMQYGMNWDPGVLQYKSVNAFGLPGLAANNFGDTKSAEGKLAISWFDNNLKGISVEDDKSIYQVCFKAIGDAGSESKFMLSGDPIIVEISAKGDEMLNLDTQLAYVKIK